MSTRFGDNADGVVILDNMVVGEFKIAPFPDDTIAVDCPHGHTLQQLAAKAQNEGLELRLVWKRGPW